MFYSFSESQSSWNFDVSSFMILLGESEEVDYRLMRRSLLECISASPISGLQSYMRSHYTITEKVGRIYIGPFARKQAPLRNLRLDRVIANKKILRDAACTVYQIPPGAPPADFTRMDPRILVWTGFSWIFIGGLIAFLAIMPQATWIGISNCAVLICVSIFLRLAEAFTTTPARGKNTRPTDHDAVVFLGRRESCLVIEGSREDVCRWTGLGQSTRKSRLARALRLSMRLITFATLCYIFVTIPNGSICDQLAFVVINAFSQVNVKVGQHLNARSCLTQLRRREHMEVETRTHVYGFLLRRFGNGDWVNDADLLPKSKAWENWSQDVVQFPRRDAKQLYDDCVEQLREKEKHDFKKPSLEPVMTDMTLVEA